MQIANSTVFNPLPNPPDFLHLAAKTAYFANWALPFVIGYFAIIACWLAPVFPIEFVEATPFPFKKGYLPSLALKHMRLYLDQITSLFCLLSLFFR